MGKIITNKLCSLALLWFLASAVSAEVEVVNAWLAAPIPGRDMSAAYMQLLSLDRDRTLVAIEADFAERAELHTHIHDKGMMRMRKLPQLHLPKAQPQQLGSGGVHIMLFGLCPKLEKYSPLELDLVFADGERVTVELQLRDRRTAGPLI